jgi:6-pyruvoyltetrahydropterin/6-carboxytetrahydropterin synthase
MSKFTITRRIEIDAAHRVPTQGSKCQHLHGHRYVIEATCEGELIETGVQSGMVMDFGFLKTLMVSHIDACFDHALIVWIDDPLLDKFKEVAGRYVVVPFIPTAENLAKIWFDVLKPGVLLNGAKLVALDVWETPNCRATYRE